MGSWTLPGMPEGPHGLKINKQNQSEASDWARHPQRPTLMCLYSSKPFMDLSSPVPWKYSVNK